MSTIECCVCYETSNKLLQLTCHHPLYQTCGRKIILNNVITCPMCRRNTSFPPPASLPIYWAALRARAPLPLHYSTAISFRPEGPPVNNVPACQGASKGARKRRNRRLTLLSPSHVISPPPPPEERKVAHALTHCCSWLHF